MKELVATGTFASEPFALHADDQGWRTDHVGLQQRLRDAATTPVMLTPTGPSVDLGEGSNAEDVLDVLHALPEVSLENTDWDAPPTPVPSPAQPSGDWCDGPIGDPNQQPEQPPAPDPARPPAAAPTAPADGQPAPTDPAQPPAPASQPAPPTDPAQPDATGAPDVGNLF